MRASHTNPEEAVEMMNAVGAKQAVPIHWGTFPLTLEPVMEPRERLVAAVQAANMDASSFAPWLVGETVVCKKK
jgi:N-acyl-phosphatidylethanolamine-hydrolysing phospholipase D